MFDWIKFLNRYKIEYVASGPNVAHGNVNVKCPLCGTDDPSEHMGISLDGSGWGCWRNPRHRGKSHIKLICLLTGVSREQASEIVGAPTSVPNNLLSSVSELLDPSDNQSKPSETLKLPKVFKEFRDVPSAKLYIKYLRDRGFCKKDIMKFTEKYGLRYCNIGAFKGRIVFTVYHDKKLVSWTGRTVYRVPSVVRYKSLTANVDKAKTEGIVPASGPINNYLLWYDDIMHNNVTDVLILVEGPFDALKLRCLGEGRGIVSTCFFTSAPTRAQIDLLHNMIPKFSKVYLLLDKGMLINPMNILSDLSAFNIRNLQLPDGYDDPGELDRMGFNKLLRRI